MVGRSALGDVVEEGGEVELGAVRNLVDDLVYERMLVLVASRVDVAQRPDRPKKMLVDCVMVVHRELHHPDDPAEVGDEAAEHAGLVHPPQGRLGSVARSQDFEEKAVGFLVLAQPRVDALQGLSDEPRRIRVNRQNSNGPRSRRCG